MQRLLRRVFTSVSTKIIFPYLILTMIVGGVGAFVVTNLATSTLQERFDNQLLDAGRIVSESIIDFEQERLEILRAVAYTEGLPQSLANQDTEALEQLIPPIAVNSDAFLISVLGLDGVEVLGWQQNGRGREGEITTQNDFSNFPDIQQVLAGRVDEFGDKRVLLAQLSDQLVLLTVGPIYNDDNLVGAVVVGESLERLVFRLSERSISRVTLLDTQGAVLSSALTDDFNVLTNIGEPPERFSQILTLLDRSSPDYKVVVTGAAEEVPLRQIEVLGQTYRLAYGHWRLRDKSFGLFTVALPSNFIVRTVATSRDTLALVFALSTVAVLTLGFAIARRILTPLEQLVNVSTAVVEGDLERRTGIERQDEIGELAHSFDLMTNFLVTRNKEFAEQATNLETILNSIADGVIVIDNRARVVNTNAAARKILEETLNVTADQLTNYRLLYGKPELRQILAADTGGDAVSFELGEEVFSVLSAPVVNQQQQYLGRVVVLRNITRESEADSIKDSFITSVSHELRTPLTSIKGYINLLLMLGKENLTAQQAHLIRIADQNTDRLIEHINRIIEITELQTGNLKLNPQKISLLEVLQDTAGRWKERLNYKELEFHCSLPNNDQLLIEGDAPRLNWVLDNLLENAIYYTPIGGQICLQAYKNHTNIHIELADTGIGIAPKDQRYLFTRFFRIDREPPYDIRGMGLGLFVVRSLVELHHGSVWVESELGEGSRFGIALPMLTEEPV